MARNWLVYTVSKVGTVRKQANTTSREEIKMGRMRENPRYNVISMRVSDEEREHLESLVEKTHKSVSDIMREAMEFFATHYEQVTMAGKAV